MTTTTVFTNNRSQAIRLPAELRLPNNVKRVDVRARGCERIIAPALTLRCTCLKKPQRKLPCA